MDTMHSHVPNIFASAILNPVGPTKSEYIARGALTVLPDGSIGSVGSLDAAIEKFPRALVHRLAPGALIIPGLIDCHTHLPQLDAAGRFDESLLEWLEGHIFPLEQRFADPDFAQKRARTFMEELVRSGTTTANVMVTVHERATDIAFGEAKRAGLRAIIGKVMMDRNSPPELKESTEEAIEASRRLILRWRDQAPGRLMYALCPRFAPSCSTRLMRDAGRIARDLSVRIHTHISETTDEVGMVRREFPHAHSYAEVYDQAGLLSPLTLLAHGVYLTDPERQLIAQRGSSIAHCPSSNLFLRSGLMDVPRTSSFGIAVGLGSDVGGGPVLDLFQTMGMACYNSKALRLGTEGVAQGRREPQLFTPLNAFYSATLGGSKALGLATTVGSLETGKRADFVVIDMAQLCPEGFDATSVDAETVASLLAYRSRGRSVRASFVDGELTHFNSEELANLADAEEGSPDKTNPARI